MTIKEAVEQRIPRVRRAQWTYPDTYLRLPLLAEGFGPWAYLYAASEQPTIGVPTGSQGVLMFDIWETDGWDAYTGPVYADERAGYEEA